VPALHTQLVTLALPVEVVLLADGQLTHAAAPTAVEYVPILQPVQGAVDADPVE
jgi:hypothetical protein